MAFYNNGFPATYSQYYAQQNYQPMMQMPVQPNQVPTPAPAPVTPPAPPSTILWVRNEREALEFPVAPNSAVSLWDSSAPVIYLKQADASGKPSTKIFDLVERVDKSADAPVAGDTPYASQKDLAALAGVVKGFDEVITSIKNDIESVKGDMYGLAGKKKSAKKSEEGEE